MSSRICSVGNPGISGAGFRRRLLAGFLKAVFKRFIKGLSNFRVQAFYVKELLGAKGFRAQHLGLRGLGRVQAVGAVVVRHFRVDSFGLCCEVSA